MRSEWKEVQFSELCTVTRGASPRPIKDFISDEGMPWVKIADATSSDSRFIEETKEKIKLEGVPKSKSVYPGDLILSNSATPGLPKFMKIEACIHDGWMLLKDFKGLDKRFAYWLLLHERKNLVVQGNGSVFTNLKTDILKNHIVKIPAENKQIEIAEVLDSVQEKIELNRQTNQTLEQIAQAIFKSWFVDFEPTRAKIIAQDMGADTATQELAAQATICGAITLEQLADIQQNLNSHLQQAIDEKLNHNPPTPINPEQLATTAALFPNALVESELGDVPEGWKVTSIDSNIYILNGFAFKSKDYVPEGTFVLRTRNFKNNIVERLQDDVFLSATFLKSHKKYLCEPFDYHLVMVGASVGNRGLIYPHHLPALRNQNMWCFRRKEKSILSQPYVKYMLDSIVNFSLGLASGSAREFFRKGDFGGQNICLGNELIQNEFKNTVLPLMQQQAKLSEEVDVLNELRDTLLPKLLSGELSVTEIEQSEAKR